MEYGESIKHYWQSSIFFSGGEWRYAYVAIGVLWVGAFMVGALL